MNAITMVKRLPVALQSFSFGSVNRTISKVFSIEKSTVIKIVQEVRCELNHVSSEFIKFPLTTLQHATAVKVFAEEAGCKIPQIVGAINEIRIGILLQASESKAD